MSNQSRGLALLFALAATASAQQLPDPTVSALKAKSQTVLITENLPARLAPSREAVIYPQVGGILQKRLFQEGTLVRADEQLYQIDDAIYQANLLSAQASLAQAQANKSLAETTANRYAPLVKEKAISKQTYDQAVSQVKVSEASIQAAKAAIKQAQINVNYAKVKAPISGIIGRSLVTEGALVGSSVKMAEIQQLDPMYLNITYSARKVIDMKRALANGMSLPNSIEISFEDGSTYEHKGKLLFAESSVDESTGELLIRGEVPNPKNELLKGMYVRVEIPTEQLENVYLIPQKAVTRGKEDTLNVISAEGNLEKRTVKVLKAYKNNWVISEGLKNGDLVALDSVSQIQQGKPVQVIEVDADGKVLSTPTPKASPSAKADAKEEKKEESTKAESSASPSATASRRPKTIDELKASEKKPAGSSAESSPSVSPSVSATASSDTIERPKELEQIKEKAKGDGKAPEVKLESLEDKGATNAPGSSSKATDSKASKAADSSKGSSKSSKAAESGNSSEKN